MDSRIAFHISHQTCHAISRVIVSRIRSQGCTNAPIILTLLELLTLLFFFALSHIRTCLTIFVLILLFTEVKNSQNVERVEWWTELICAIYIMGQIAMNITKVRVKASENSALQNLTYKEVHDKRYFVCCKHFKSTNYWCINTKIVDGSTIYVFLLVFSIYFFTFVINFYFNFNCGLARWRHHRLCVNSKSIECP